MTKDGARHVGLPPPFVNNGQVRKLEEDTLQPPGERKRAAKKEGGMQTQRILLMIQQLERSEL